jgi:hypothetical protein
MEEKRDQVDRELGEIKVGDAFSIEGLIANESIRMHVWTGYTVSSIDGNSYVLVDGKGGERRMTRSDIVYGLSMNMIRKG